MNKHYIIAAMAILSMSANATTTYTNEAVKNAKVVANAEDTNAEETEDDGTVVVDGFRCYLANDGTFSIKQIESINGEELVVPYTILYAGKYYNCETINLSNLHGEFDSEHNNIDTKIKPYVKSVVFSEGIKTLKGHFPLCYCKKVTLPSSVDSIQYTAFNYGIDAGHNDEEETSWWMEKYMTNFQAFDLEEFVVDKNNPNYTAKDGLLYTKDMKTLVSCPRGKRGVVIVPEGVETLAVACFSICNRLTEIQLPSTLRSLSEGYGRYAGFHYCLNLEKVNIPEGIEKITGGSFRHCDKLKSLTLPSTLKTLDVNYMEAPNDTRQLEVFGPMFSLEELDMENTAIEVLEGVYYGDNGEYGTVPFNERMPIKNLRFPKNIRVIGKKVFARVNPPTELHLPATIESLGEQFINPFIKYGENDIYGSSCSQTESPVKDIYCYWTTPLEVADNIFGYVKVKENRVTKNIFPQDWANLCTLHVPTGTVAAYRANSVWGKFKNIVEFTPTTGIDAITDNTATTVHQGIYTLQGMKIAYTQLDKLPSGIYIVNGKKITVR